MFGFEKINLRNEKGRCFFYNKSRIWKIKKEIEALLEEEPFMDDFHFARKMLLSLEIKTNNAIEGLHDDLSNIDEVIENRTSHLNETNARIINLYNAYRYILLNSILSKKSLKKLYSILSNNLLDEYSQENMGEYYRTKDVAILDDQIGPFPATFDKGMPPETIEKAMDDLFKFIEEADPKDNLEAFIDSQIIHFYFVYVHPYFDVNGRCARTMSLWYLLNNEAYPFTIFNRGISLSKGKYKEKIKKSRRGDITPFLEYSLKTLKRELIKERVIHNIKNNAEPLSNEEYETLEYILTTKHQKIDEVIGLCRRFNNKHIRDDEIIEQKIIPLLEKEIIVLDLDKLTIKINKKYITLENSKIRKGKTRKYLAKEQ